MLQMRNIVLNPFRRMSGQVGETMQGTRFFIEDYVMTFLRKCMGDKRKKE